MFLGEQVAACLLQDIILTFQLLSPLSLLYKDRHKAYIRSCLINNTSTKKILTPNPTNTLATLSLLNFLTPNDNYSGCTAPLTSKRCILYIYSTHIGTEYIKQGIYSPFFPLQNAVCFNILTYLVPGIFTFYIQGVLKLKK